MLSWKSARMRNLLPGCEKKKQQLAMKQPGTEVIKYWQGTGDILLDCEWSHCFTFGDWSSSIWSSNSIFSYL